jgi:hypothetical protein
LNHFGTGGLDLVEQRVEVLGGEDESIRAFRSFEGEAARSEVVAGLAVL